MPSIAELVRDYRDAVYGQAGLLGDVPLEPAASDEDIQALSLAVGFPVPEELCELWSLSASGHHVLPFYLFSPLVARNASVLWKELISEWSPIDKGESVLSENVIAFGTPSGGEIACLLDGKHAGSIVYLDSLHLPNADWLAGSLKDYLAAATQLAREGNVQVVTTTLPNREERILATWRDDPLPITEDQQIALRIGSRFR